MSAIQKQDKESFAILAKEIRRQQETLDLIASENIASPAVREAEATVFMNKYSEGYPGAWYYKGNDYVEEMVRLGQKRAKKLFKLQDEWSVNMFALSGAAANIGVYFGLLKPRVKIKNPDGSETEAGDTALGMRLDHGGHLSHGHKVTVTGKIFRFFHYGVTDEGYLDYDSVEKLAKEHKPKLIVCGASAYPRFIDFERFRNIADSVGALLMADVAHIAGLIAGGVHPSPFPYCHIVTTTTHKTLRGPRGALIFARNDIYAPGSKRSIAEAVDRSIFPGLQGGPHDHSVFAITVALGEALRPDFRRYCKQIVQNAKVLAKELVLRDFQIISGGTDNHLMLIDLTNKGLTGEEASERLYRAGIVVNKNAIPDDPRGPRDPSGMRLGTPSVTTRGMKEREMKMVAEWIDRVIQDAKEIPKVRLSWGTKRAGTTTLAKRLSFPSGSQ